MAKRDDWASCKQEKEVMDGKTTDEQADQRVDGAGGREGRGGGDGRGGVQGPGREHADVLCLAEKIRGPGGPGRSGQAGEGAGDGERPASAGGGRPGDGDRPAQGGPGGVLRADCGLAGSASRRSDEGRPMFVTILCMALVVLLDGLTLLFDPSLYRRGMAFVEDEIGPVWMLASGFAFIAPGLAWLYRAWFVAAPALPAVIGVVSVGIGVFFALAPTERFGSWGQWWRSRSNGQYRLAGLLAVVLAVLMLLLAFELRA